MPPRIVLSLLMAFSNAITRALPVALLTGRRLPPDLTTWLKYVPVPVLSAMLAIDLLVRENRIVLDFSNLPLWVAIPCFLVAKKSQSFFTTVLFGMGLLAALRSVALLS